MRLTVLTGVSCAGKTVTAEMLEKHYDAVVRGIDEDAGERPTTAWLDWLRWRAAEELAWATECARDAMNVHVVLSGIVWPFRLIESPAWRPAMKAGVRVSFVMLDPPWKTLRSRLAERCAGKPKAERRELARYNRELRRALRTQVDAVEHGWRFRPPPGMSAESVADRINDQIVEMWRQ